MLTDRKFLRVVFLTTASLIAAAWLCTATMRMWFMEGGYAIWLAKQDMLRACDFGDLLILGDSRPEAGIRPDLMPRRTVNLAFGGASPAETYFVARKALACPRRPRLIVYSQTMNTFGGFTDGLWLRSVKYGFLTLRQIAALRADIERLHDRPLSSIDTHDGLTGPVREVVYGAGFPAIFVPELVRARLIGRHAPNAALYDATSASRGYVVYGGAGAAVWAPGAIADFVPSPLQMRYFRMTLDLFREAGIPLVFVSMPTAERSSGAYRPGAAEAFAGMLRREATGQRGFTILSADVSVWPDSQFAEGWHLNEAGAAVFSARLADCLTVWLAGERSTCDFTWQAQRPQRAGLDRAYPDPTG